MPVLVILIIVSLVFYVFYKIKEWRTRAPYEKRWLKAKANISLGIFIISFGLNRLLINESTYDLVIGSIFLVLGVFNLILGYKAYKHFLPLVIEESENRDRNA